MSEATKSDTEVDHLIGYLIGFNNQVLFIWPDFVCKGSSTTEKSCVWEWLKARC